MFSYSYPRFRAASSVGLQKGFGAVEDKVVLGGGGWVSGRAAKFIRNDTLLQRSSRVNRAVDGWMGSWWVGGRGVH